MKKAIVIILYCIFVLLCSSGSEFLQKMVENRLVVLDNNNVIIDLDMDGIFSIEEKNNISIRYQRNDNINEIVKNILEKKAILSKEYKVRLLMISFQELTESDQLLSCKEKIYELGSDLSIKGIHPLYIDKKIVFLPRNTGRFLICGENINYPAFPNNATFYENGTLGSVKLKYPQIITILDGAEVKANCRIAFNKDGTISWMDFEWTKIQLPNGIIVNANWINIYEECITGINIKTMEIPTPDGRMASVYSLGLYPNHKIKWLALDRQLEIILNGIKKIAKNKIMYNEDGTVLKIDW